MLEAAQDCECFITIGSSGTVHPGAAAAAGAHVIEIDPEVGNTGLWLQGTATEVVPALVRRAFGD